MAYDVINRKRVSGDWCCGIGDDVGSVILSTSEQNRLYNKIDDVRYDIRKTGAMVGAGVAAIAGAVAILGLGEMWRAFKGRT